MKENNEKSHSTEAIMLRRSGPSSIVYLILIFFIIGPLVFVAIFNLLHYYVSIPLTLITTLLVYKTYKHLSSVSFLRILFESDKISFSKTRGISSTERWNYWLSSEVKEVSTYSPFPGGTGIKVWNKNGEIIKFKMISDVGRSSRSLTFLVEEGPKSLNETNLKSRISNKYSSDAYCSLFLEELLNEIGHLGYKARY